MDRNEVDPIYLDAPYYIYPDGELAAEPFRVIGQAMAHSNKVGLGHVTISSPERPVLVEPRGAGLMMSTLCSADEVRPADFGSKAKGELDADMVAIAETIIERRSGAFEPTSFQDRNQAALRELVEAKAKGLATTPRAIAEPTKVINLMEDFKRSLAQDAEPEPEKAGASKPTRAKPVPDRRASVATTGVGGREKKDEPVEEPTSIDRTKAAEEGLMRWASICIDYVRTTEKGERAVPSLLLAAIFFAGIHLGIAGTTVRDRATAALGESAYMVAFSLASVVGLAWIVAAYNRAPYIATWGMLEWWKPFAIILMLPASLLVVIGLTTPNPTSVAQEGRLAQPPQGIVRVTRHPFLTGVGLWALVHLIGNGDVASLVFFATWAVVALAGTVSIDRKRRRLMGAAWEAFAAQTSVVPFAAVAAGRNRFRLREIGAWRWGIAVVAYALMLGGHSHIIGVSPFPA